MFNFDIFKGLLILIELGKFGRKIRYMPNLAAQLEFENNSIINVGKSYEALNRLIKKFHEKETEAVRLLTRVRKVTFWENF